MATLLILAQRDLPWIVALFLILNISVGGGLYLSLQGINSAYLSSATENATLAISTRNLACQLYIRGASYRFCYALSVPPPLLHSSSISPFFTPPVPLCSEIYEVWMSGFIRATEGHSKTFGYPEYVCYKLFCEVHILCVCRQVASRFTTENHSHAATVIAIHTVLL